MIELLTPPVAADPATPLAPAAILGEVAPANFAALLGTIVPSTPVVAATFPEVIVPTIAQIAPVVAGAPVAQAAPVVALAALTVPAVAVSMVTDSVDPPAEAAEPVKLPTLPLGFFAQRLPVAAKPLKADPKPAPQAASDEKEATTEGEEQPAVAALAPPAIYTVAPPAVPVTSPSAPVSPPAVPVAPPSASITPTPSASVAPVADGDRQDQKEAPAAVRLETSALAVKTPLEQPVALMAVRAVPPAPTAVASEQRELAEPGLAALEGPPLETVSVEATAIDAALSADAKSVVSEPEPLGASPRAVESPVTVTAFAEVLAVQQPVAAQQPAAAAPQLQPSMSVALDELFVAAAPDSAWIDRLAGDITLLASGESREAHLKINPRALGEMSIKLEVEGQRTRVNFTVETPQALAMMTDGAPRLTQIVEANGLKLDGATVDLDQRRDGRAASEHEQQREAPEPSRGLARARDEIARLVSRTRIATAHERFA